MRQEPDIKVIANELSKLFSVISHPDRICIIKELRLKELDVQGLALRLSMSPSRTSQHLRILKDMRLVKLKIVGKRHFFSLARPKVADWILLGVQFSAPGLTDTQTFNQAVRNISSICKMDPNYGERNVAYE